jgi:CheY-like chemotaxis protein
MKEYNLAKDCVVIDSSTEAYTYIENELKPENEYPDLILLDINMPGHNGFELLERIESKIKEHNLKIKVYMLSSSNLDKDIDKAKQYSCVVDYIVKPLTVEKFMAFM